MRFSFILAIIAFAGMPLSAQRHSGSPPTAPPRPPAPAPIVPISSGLGPIQFVAVNYGVPAPQSLTRQLRIDDERTRAAALSAVGAPGQYLQRGHVAMPRSVVLEFAALGSDDVLDAILTVELDQHLVTAILIPDDDNWRRIATVFVPDSADDPRSTPDTFVRTQPSILEAHRYRAVFHASLIDPKGNYLESEAQLRVINKHAVITTSFVSASRDCTVPTATNKKAPLVSCTILRRWLQSDPTDPFHHFTLVTATGQEPLHETQFPLDSSRIYESSHLRTYACQPFIFSDTTEHFEPTANSAPCAFK
jgi:hypothetical protein